MAVPLPDAWLAPLRHAADRAVSRVKPREFRHIAILFAVVMWTAYAVNLSTPGLIDRVGQLKGADFLQFYVQGHLAARGAADVLYDAGAYAAATRQLVPEAVEVFPPVYPPHVSVLFAPFSLLSYGWAVVAWSVLSIALYAAACAVVWRRCPALRPHGPTVAWLAAGSPAFFNLVGHGQTTSLVVAALVGMFVALDAKRPLVAGLLLGLLAYKPQVGIAAGVTLIAARHWSAVLGAAIGVALSVGLGWLYWGPAPWLAYLEVLARPGELTSIVEQKLHHSHSLRTWWALLIPWPPVALTLYVVSAAWVLRHTIAVWRGGASLAWRFAVLLLATVLVSPHVFVYDLVILAPTFLILADRALAHPTHPVSSGVLCLVTGAWLTPAVGLVANLTRVQLSVVCFVALFAVAVAVSEETMSRAPAPGPPAPAS